MTKRFGFTLAEVLITLGIIGVVAAMTMPTLMNSTNGAQYKTAYKKALSVISQAVVLNIALDEWGLADATATTAYPFDGDDAKGAQSLFNLFYTRMNHVSESSTGLGYKWSAVDDATENTYAEAALDEDSNYALFFNDGIAISFPKTASACTMDLTRNAGADASTACRGIIDVNGQKAPNRQVKCDGGNKTSGCEVTNPTDIYPIIMFDQQILPNSAAAKAVLYAK